MNLHSRGQVAVLLSLFAQVAGGQTMITSGLICEDTTWTAAGSPYVVTNSVVVGCGATLTIEPGVTVRMGTGNGISVGSLPFGTGALVARGTQSSPISFVPIVNHWPRILFADQAVDAVVVLDEAAADVIYESGSILEHVIIENAGVGNVGAVSIENSRPFLNRCTIRECLSSGVLATGTMLPPQRIVNCEIHDCPNSAIRIESNAVDGEAHWIAENHLHENSGLGAGIHANGKAMMLGNIIENGSGTGIFVELNGDDSIMIDNSVCGISGVNGGGTRIRGDRVECRGNYFCNNFAQLGGGIYLEGDHSIVGGNTVADNASINGGGGIYVRARFVELSNNLVERNMTTGPNSSGGGLFLFTGGTHVIQDSVYRNNSSMSRGGGIYCDANDCTFRNVRISQNHVAQLGGAMALYLANNIRLIDCRIDENTSDMSSGGIYVRDSQFFRIDGDPESGQWNVFRGNEGLAIHNDSYFWTYGAHDVDARWVDWGTNDPLEIEDLIGDFFDDSTRAFVIYLPWITSGLGDFDDDGDVDLLDFGQFQICYTGSDGGPVASNCEAGDFDDDGDVDLVDFGQFSLAFTGSL